MDRTSATRSAVAAVLAGAASLLLAPAALAPASRPEARRLRT
jgi:hypothetical protein